MFSYQVRFLFSFVVRRSQPYSLDLLVGDSFAFGDSTHSSVRHLFRRAVVAGGPYSQFVSGCPRSCCCSSGVGVVCIPPCMGNLPMLVVMVQGT